MAQAVEKNKGLRILVFDGGDLRAISQLDILAELLHRVGFKRETDILPCQFFDVIVGVGTGGIIAILLVIFCMSVEDAKEEFIHMYRTVFQPRQCSPSQRSELLRSAVHNLLDRKGWRREKKMLDSGASNTECHLVVGAVSITDIHAFRKFKNYRSRGSSLDVTIVEAILATCAFPGLFNSTKIGPVNQQDEFIAAKYLFNNPTREAIQEVDGVFSSNEPVGGIVSLGCGKPRLLSSQHRLDSIEMKELLEAIASDCERTATDLERLLGPSTPYYRLSVDRGLEVEDASESGPGSITAHTKTYLEQPSINRYIDRCIGALELPPNATIGYFCRAPTRPSTTTLGLPPLSSSYVERSKPTKFLYQYLIPNYDGLQRIAIISGMPGVGKTQLVAKFIRHYEYEFPKIIYVDASSEQTIRSTLISRVNAAGYDCWTVKDAINTIAQWDEKVDGRWCLIFDNADDENVGVPDLFPPNGQGTIIITTRDPNLALHSTEGHLELKQMSMDEAVKTLLNIVLDLKVKTTSAQQDAAIEIAEELGCLPVALVQAGCYIKKNKCLPDFLNQLQESRRRILQNHAPPRQFNGYNHSVYAVFNMAVNQFHPRVNALLKLLSCAHNIGFPRKLITLAARHHFLLEPVDLAKWPRQSEITDLLHEIICRNGEWDAYFFDECLAELQKASLITLEENQDAVMLSMHPLLRAWAQDQLTAPESRDDPKKYRAAMARLLSCGTGPEGASLHEHLISHIRALKPHWKEVHVNDRASFADLLAFPGIADDTVEIWESVFEELKEMNGARDEQVLHVMARLARAYGTQGDEKREKRTRETLEELEGSPHPAENSSSRSASIPKHAPGHDQTSQGIVTAMTMAQSPTTYFPAHPFSVTRSTQAETSNRGQIRLQIEEKSRPSHLPVPPPLSYQWVPPTTASRNSTISDASRDLYTNMPSGSNGNSNRVMKPPRAFPSRQPAFTSPSHTQTKPSPAVGTARSSQNLPKTRSQQPRHHPTFPVASIGGIPVIFPANAMPESHYQTPAGSVPLQTIPMPIPIVSSLQPTLISQPGHEMTLAAPKLSRSSMGSEPVPVPVADKRPEQDSSPAQTQSSLYSPTSSSTSHNTPSLSQTSPRTQSSFHSSPGSSSFTRSLLPGPRPRPPSFRPTQKSHTAPTPTHFKAASSSFGKQPTHRPAQHSAPACLPGEVPREQDIHTNIGISQSHPSSRDLVGELARQGPRAQQGSQAAPTRIPRLRMSTNPTNPPSGPSQPPQSALTRRIPSANEFPFLPATAPPLYPETD